MSKALSRSDWLAAIAIGISVVSAAAPILWDYMKLRGFVDGGYLLECPDASNALAEQTSSETHIFSRCEFYNLTAGSVAIRDIRPAYFYDEREVIENRLDETDLRADGFRVDDFPKIIEAGKGIKFPITYRLPKLFSEAASKEKCPWLDKAGTTLADLDACFLKTSENGKPLTNSVYEGFEIGLLAINRFGVRIDLANGTAVNASPRLKWLPIHPNGSIWELASEKDRDWFATKMTGSWTTAVDLGEEWYKPSFAKTLLASFIAATVALFAIWSLATIGRTIVRISATIYARSMRRSARKSVGDKATGEGQLSQNAAPTIATKEHI